MPPTYNTDGPFSLGAAHSFHHNGQSLSISNTRYTSEMAGGRATTTASDLENAWLDPIHYQSGILVDLTNGPQPSDVFDANGPGGSLLTNNYGLTGYLDHSMDFENTQAQFGVSNLSEIGDDHDVLGTGFDSGPVLSSQYNTQLGDQWGSDRVPADFEMLSSPNSYVTDVHIVSATQSKDSWTQEQEDFLMISKKSNMTFPTISAAMLQRFGVDRNVNVLSKKYRAVIHRVAEDSQLHLATVNALPQIMRCLEDEMNKLNPGSMSAELANEVRNELRRKLPTFVHKLVLGNGK